MKRVWWTPLASKGIEGGDSRSCQDTLTARDRACALEIELPRPRGLRYWMWRIWVVLLERLLL